MGSEEKIEAYFAKQEQWSEGLNRLRIALKELQYKEEIKWGMPTYTIEGKNLISLCGFKSHFGIWFHQGVFLTDPHHLMVNAQEGKTKGMRHIKFHDSNEVDIDVLKPYLVETIHNHREGKVITVERKTRLSKIPKELEAALKGEVKQAFEKLSASKQNDFVEYIVTAKREATKLARLEKIIPMIMQGEGLNDKYK
jgi:uncharacterized protein YdeI (YjbR/CyaY-like superfamily)